MRQLRETEEPYYRGLITGFIAGFVGLVVHAIGVNTFIIVRIMEPFWFFVGIITVLPMLKREERRTRPHPVWSADFYRRRPVSRAPAPFLTAAKIPQAGVIEVQATKVQGSRFSEKSCRPSHRFRALP